MNETKDIDILNASWKTKVSPEQSAEIERLIKKHGNFGIYVTKKYFHALHGVMRSYPADSKMLNMMKELNADDIIAALRKLDEESV